MKNKFMILKRGLAAVLTAALALTGLPAAMPERAVKKAEAADVTLKNPLVEYVEETEEADGTLKNPRIVADRSMKAGQKVTWDCVYFGNYPQAEVIPSNVEYTALDASLRQDGDVIVSDSVYDALQSASGWDANDDIILNGVKYRRMKQEDATNPNSYDWDEYYQWSNDTDYHYFKYEPIKWRVLRIDGNQALLLSDISLDDQKYNTLSMWKMWEWELSTLRSWLNGYGAGSSNQSVDYSQKNFIGSAFTSSEREAIVSTSLKNVGSIEYGGVDRGDTTDKIFLLSESDMWNTDTAKMYGFVEDARTYDEARRCQSSTYAKAMGIRSRTVTDYSGNCKWWLRTEGVLEEAVMVVEDEGRVYSGGEDPGNFVVGVRPALTLNLSSSNLYTYAGTVCSKTFPGRKVNWDCVWFGSYPQAEVIPSNVEYTALDTSLRRDGDVIVSDSVYDALQNASGWDANNDIILNGAKYRRMKQEDATYIDSDDWDEYYQWSNDTDYHYFKYEPIKWRVLRTDGIQALLLSDIALDDQKYHTVDESVTWETSTIRSWLNGYGAGSNQQSEDYSRKSFIGSAFTVSERAAIVSTSLENADNIDYGTEGGNNTTDKIFLFSESDVWNTDTAKAHGFMENGDADDEARRCQSSAYAKAMGMSSSIEKVYAGNGGWWLRSPGDDEDYAMGVDGCGLVYGYGDYVDDVYYGVRPALNLNLSSSNLYTWAGTVCSDGTKEETGKDWVSPGTDDPAPSKPDQPKPEQPVTPTPGKSDEKAPAIGTKLTDAAGKAVYKVTGAGKVEYANSLKKKSSAVTVPEKVTLDGKRYQVTTIGNSAFKNCKKLKTVVIGKGVTSIGMKAFYGCKALKKITIKSTKLKKVGKSAFKGIYAKAVIKVPKAKLKAYQKLLKKKGQGKKVRIVK